MYAAEFASAASFGMWFVFDNRTLLGMNVPFTGTNVDDNWRETMTQAHELAFPNYDGTLVEHWLEMREEGALARNHFVGEIETGASFITVAEELEQQGFTNISIPE